MLSLGCLQGQVGIALSKEGRILSEDEQAKLQEELGVVAEEVVKVPAPRLQHIFVELGCKVLIAQLRCRLRYSGVLQLPTTR